MKSIAIVAPDTDSGKTIITAALLINSKKINGKSIVMKPVQTGAEVVEGKRYSPDLTTIETLCDITFPRKLYHHLVPYNFLSPCSPHLAAKKEIQEVSVSNIKQNLISLHMQFNMTLVETAGGVLSPLTEEMSNLDMIKELETPVVLVSLNRLGGISATLSALENIRTQGIKLLGVVLVDTDVRSTLDREILTDNERIIQKMGTVEHIVRVPFLEDVESEFDVLPTILEEFSKKIFQ